MGDVINALSSTTETLLKKEPGIPISVNTSGVRMLMEVLIAMRTLRNIRKTCVFVTRFMPPKWEKPGTMLATTTPCGTPKTTPPSISTLKTCAPGPQEQSQTIAAELTQPDTRMTVQ